jgi:hypothetical protein
MIAFLPRQTLAHEYREDPPGTGLDTVYVSPAHDLGGAGELHLEFLGYAVCPESIGGSSVTVQLETSADLDEWTAVGAAVASSDGLVVRTGLARYVRAKVIFAGSFADHAVTLSVLGKAVEG